MFIINKMSKTQQLTILVALVSIFLLLFIVGVIKLPQSSPKSVNVKFDTGTKTEVPSSPTKNETLPIDPNDPSVTSLQLSYTLKGTVEQITSTDLAISNQGKSFPTFPINKNTKVTKVIEKDLKIEQENVTVSDIKIGDSVKVMAIYSQNKKTWGVQTILIFTKAPSTPTTPKAENKTP